MDASTLKDLARKWAETTQDCHVDFVQLDHFIDWICDSKNTLKPLDDLPIFTETAKLFSVNRGGPEKRV